jgi:antitoxin CptB
VNDQLRLKKLKYRAWHRGFVEADLILGGFADAHVAELSDDDLDRFEILLEQPDPDLYAWIVGQADTPAEMDGPLLDRVKAFVPHRVA